MTRLLRYAGVAATVCLALTACGDDSPATSDPPLQTPTTTAPGTLPLTITRSGGFAGFADRIVVASDGAATVSRRGESDTRCHVDPKLLATLTTATAQIPWPSLGAKSPTPRHPDDLVIAVATSTGTTRLDDPRAKPLSDPVSRLLDDAYAAPTKRTLCHPI